MADEVRSEKPTIPCRRSRQTQCANVAAESPAVYYPRSMTVPFLGNLQNELEDRFSSNANVKKQQLGSAWFPVF